MNLKLETINQLEIGTLLYNYDFGNSELTSEELRKWDKCTELLHSCYEKGMDAEECFKHILDEYMMAVGFDKMHNPYR